MTNLLLPLRGSGASLRSRSRLLVQRRMLVLVVSDQDGLADPNFVKTDCVPFLRDVDFPTVYALAGCGRRCATLFHRGETARFQSETDGVTSSRFGATVFFIGDWPYHSILSTPSCVHALELRANLRCVQNADTTSDHCRRHEAGTLQGLNNHFGDRSQGKARLCFQRADRTSDRRHGHCPYSCSSWSGVEDLSCLCCVECAPISELLFRSKQCCMQVVTACP